MNNDCWIEYNRGACVKDRIRLMARSHVKYNGSACVPENIFSGMFVRGTRGSACVKNRYCLTHFQAEHIRSTCLKDKMSLLENSHVTHKFVN